MINNMSIKTKLLLLSFIILFPFLGIIGMSFVNNKATIGTLEMIKEKEFKVIKLSSELGKQVVGLENYLLKIKGEASSHKNHLFRGGLPPAATRRDRLAWRSPGRPRGRLGTDDLGGICAFRCLACVSSAAVWAAVSFSVSLRWARVKKRHIDNSA